MNANKNKSTSSAGLVGELLRQAEAEFKDDRRSEQRYPFFRPASVQVDDHNFSAFIREIGATGMGLLHSMELPLKEVTVKVGEHSQKLIMRIERCASIGEGWYISGGKIVEKSA